MESEEIHAEALSPQASGSSGASAKVFLGGLSWETNEDKLREHFDKYGPIKEVIVMRDRMTGKPRGFGFITFESEEAAKQACDDTHNLDGRTIDAKPSVPQDSQQRPRSKKVFVGGLAPETTPEQFKDYFQRFGEVVEAQIMVDHNSNRSRGFGFVTFTDESAVHRVFGAGPMHEVAGKRVEVKSATPKGSGPQGRGAATSPGGPAAAAAAAAAAAVGSLAPGGGPHHGGSSGGAAAGGGGLPAAAAGMAAVGGVLGAGAAGGRGPSERPFEYPPGAGSAPYGVGPAYMPHPGYMYLPYPGAFPGMLLPGGYGAYPPPYGAAPAYPGSMVPVPGYPPQQQPPAVAAPHPAPRPPPSGQPQQAPHYLVPPPARQPRSAQQQAQQRGGGVPPGSSGSGGSSGSSSRGGGRGRGGSGRGGGGGGSEQPAASNGGPPAGAHQQQPKQQQHTPLSQDASGGPSTDGTSAAGGDGGN